MDRAASRRPGRAVDGSGHAPGRRDLLRASGRTGWGWSPGWPNPTALESDARAWADQIAQLAPLTLAGFKVGLNQAEGPLDWTPEYRAAFDAAWSSADLQEGLAAFAERRPPEFRGR